MSKRIHSYQPRVGHGLPHDPIASILGPRPIGWISSRDADGRLNLAPYSFFNIFNYRPPIVAFSSVGEKDSVRNCRVVGEFVYNLATRVLAEQMNLTSAAVASDVDEFSLAGLTPADSKVVSVPRVEESPVALECRVCRVSQLEGADTALIDTWMVLAEVVAVHIDESLLRNGVYDTAAARPILRGGGAADYFEITPQARFAMRRPLIAATPSGA
jgi:flavin reductase (DIM6/NTAB) family NADH-FMN oxidoreductase RutF